jgi:uncharacterized membrane protein YagU involved in acid resistance
MIARVTVRFVNSIAIMRTHDRQADNGRTVEPPLLAGLVGGLIAGWTMNMFSRVAAIAGDGREAPGAAPGRDRFGRGAQPPQALRTADCDATILAGSAVYRAMAGRNPDRDVQPWIGSAMHYAFSAGLGMAYAVAASRVPVLRRGRGLLYGALVWSVADEGVMPALGLSRGPRRLDPRVHAYALLAHLVYGATLDAVVRSGRVSAGG